jgi:hypothetical protein
MGKRIGWIAGALLLAGCAADFELTLLRAETRLGNGATVSIIQDADAVVLHVGESTGVDRGAIVMRVNASPPVECGQTIEAPLSSWYCADDAGSSATAEVR